VQHLLIAMHCRHFLILPSLQAAALLSSFAAGELELHAGTLSLRQSRGTLSHIRVAHRPLFTYNGPAVTLPQLGPGMGIAGANSSLWLMMQTLRWTSMIYEHTIMRLFDRRSHRYVS